MNLSDLPKKGVFQEHVLEHPLFEYHNSHIPCLCSTTNQYKNKSQSNIPTQTFSQPIFPSVLRTLSTIHNKHQQIIQKNSSFKLVLFLYCLWLPLELFVLFFCFFWFWWFLLFCIGKLNSNLGEIRIKA